MTPGEIFILGVVIGIGYTCLTNWWLDRLNEPN